MKTVYRLVLPVILTTCALRMTADEMPFQGSTSGSFTDSTTATVVGFVGANFGPSVTSGGNATLSNLGTFSILDLSVLANTIGTNLGNFDLTVIFTIPDGANPSNPIVADVTGTINNNNANNLTIDFGPGQTVNFTGTDGSGSFLLTINDVAFANGSNTQSSLLLTGSISEAVFTPGTNPTSTVPEPSSISLLSTVALTAGFTLYRRRRRGNIS